MEKSQKGKLFRKWKKQLSWIPHETVLLIFLIYLDKIKLYNLDMNLWLKW
jgi:hypothetical protein